MVALSLSVQVLFSSLTTGKGSYTKIKEVLICLLFLRLAVDIYRVGTNQRMEVNGIKPLHAMIGNKCAELATESIPGCILSDLHLDHKP